MMKEMLKINNHYLKRVWAVSVFSVAMGLLEAVVVVYLRMVYYPEGFQFPLTLLDERVYGIELARELATLVMLGSVSFLAGRKRSTRFAYFLLSFGVWDIFYYVFLKVFLDWPATIMDWDILFLIPAVWAGPVLAPVICSLLMIILSLLILYFDDRGLSVPFRLMEFGLILLGAAVIFYTFIRDYAALLIRASRAGEAVEPFLVNFIPGDYPWGIFAAGIALIGLAVACWARQIIRRIR